MASSVYIVEPDIFTIMFEELRKKGGDEAGDSEVRNYKGNMDCSFEKEMCYMACSQCS